jgi:uncharacterized YigZ family protein
VLKPESGVFWEPAAEAEAEVKVKRSRFIARLFPCREGEEARRLLARAEAAHRDATHHCWAYLLGPEPEVLYASDGGEPAGTAGKPILATLRRSEMVNLMVVVTRYFGGVKLGVRGLIEAYGQAASEAVLRTERLPRVRSRRLTIRMPYPSIGDVARLLEPHATDTPTWAYGAEAELTVSVSDATQLALALDELLARKKILFWEWDSGVF